ncbi:MAG: hypothetical protein GC204_09230 [Chloroflexi bacterium]|nr:hypothetical protein [Chloroflexota bacterium]
MDPIIAYRLGQIRHKEILESCERNRLVSVEHPFAEGVRKRVRTLVSALNTRTDRPRSAQPVERSESFATSR